MIPARRAALSKQRGTLIIALMAGIAITMILSTVAVQAWSDIARRDAEAEMIFRAEDIVRAIRRFQLDQGKLPLEFKELTEPGQKGQYFLRKLWKDPLVKGGKWQFVYANPAGGLYDPSDPSTSPTGAPPQEGQPAAGLARIDPLFPPKANEAGGGGGEVSGLPIAGVKTRCTEHPFRRYKDKTEYREWVFSIFDQDQRVPAMQQTPVNPNNTGGSPSLGDPGKH